MRVNRDFHSAIGRLRAATEQFSTDEQVGVRLSALIKAAEAVLVAVDTTPLARAGDPATSKQAAESITEATLRANQRAVLHFYREWGPDIDAFLVEQYPQLARSRGWQQQSPSGLRTRRKELTTLGYLERIGERKHNGRQAGIYRATTKG